MTVVVGAVVEIRLPCCECLPPEPDVVEAARHLVRELTADVWPSMIIWDLVSSERSLELMAISGCGAATEGNAYRGITVVSFAAFKDGHESRATLIVRVKLNVGDLNFVCPRRQMRKNVSGRSRRTASSYATMSACRLAFVKIARSSWLIARLNQVTNGLSRMRGISPASDRNREHFAGSARGAHRILEPEVYRPKCS
ncbi:hypothetical protein KC345_g203 [Hortaea werneckii]|nr:hypothetical protein KC345_g203 [Hortaea werneckii]